jgi:hypothetical protein
MLIIYFLERICPDAKCKEMDTSVCSVQVRAENAEEHGFRGRDGFLGNYGGGGQVSVCRKRWHSSWVNQRVRRDSAMPMSSSMSVV